jgi:hypothetical protein
MEETAPLDATQVPEEDLMAVGTPINGMSEENMFGSSEENPQNADGNEDGKRNEAGRDEEEGEGDSSSKKEKRDKKNKTKKSKKNTKAKTKSKSPGKKRKQQKEATQPEGNDPVTFNDIFGSHDEGIS